MKESQVFQDGRTLEPLEVRVVRDRTAQLRPAAVSPSSSHVPVFSSPPVKSSQGSAAAVGLLGLVACSGLFLGLGHFFGILAQNWEGNLSSVSLSAERGWSAHLRRAWSLSGAPEAADIHIARATHFGTGRSFYRRSFAALPKTEVIQTTQKSDNLVASELRAAFLDWRSIERSSAAVTTQENEWVSAVEYSENQVAITPARPRKVVSVAPRILNQEFATASVAKAPAPPTPKAPDTFAERFSATGAQVPGGFSWDALSLVQARPRPEPLRKIEVQSAPVATTVAAVTVSESCAAGTRPALDFQTLGHQLGSWSQGQARQGWMRLTNSKRWQVAFFGDAASCVPTNVEQELSTIAQDSGRVLHSQLGVVFGRVAQGWDIEVSGRSSKDLHWLSATEADGTRTFYWTNIPPGFATVKYFKQDQPQESGALAVPVQTRISTYVDLTQVRRVTVSGRVLSGSKKTQPPVAGVEVVAIHHRAAAVKTDRDGVFVFQPLWLAKGYPLDLDAQAVDSWSHRYSMRVEQVDQSELSLYLLSPEQIRGWLAAFQGDLSPESAMVVGAFSSRARQELGTEGLLPQLEPWERSLSLMPETYSLSSQGDLRPGRPVEDGADRFLLVQVPGGPSKVLFTDSRGKEHFSELRFHSPNVISVVGPF